MNLSIVLRILKQQRNTAHPVGNIIELIYIYRYNNSVPLGEKKHRQVMAVVDRHFVTGQWM
jgi:hypothetical protein